MKWVHRTVTVCCCLALMATVVRGQDSSIVSVRGTIGLTYDLYSMRSTGASTTTPRRPASVVRLTADPSIRVSDWLEIPIRISFTFREASIIQPSLPTPDLASFLQNPMNQLLISPRIGWATFHLGSIVPSYGSLTVSNAQVFGAGFDLRPAPLRVQGIYGILNRPIAVDTTAGRRGSYARSLLALRIGSASGPNSFMGLTLARMSDNKASIPLVTNDITVAVPIVDSNGVVVRDSAYALIARDTLQPLPQEGLSMGLDFRSEVGTGGFIGGEIAGTAFTRDQAAPLLSDPIPVLNLFMDTRTSTRMDVAGKLEGGYSERSWGVTGGVTYIGPGYVSLTQPFLQQDRIDVTVTPRVSMFDGRLSGSATVGWRMLDLIKSLGNGSRQLLLNLNATGVLTDQLTLSASFTNFGYRQTRSVDSLRYEQVTTSFSFVPTYMIITSAMRHLINASLGFDSFNDLTVSNVASASNTTFTAMATYSISPIRGEWSANAMFSYVTNDRDVSKTTMQSATVGGRVRFWEGRLVPDVSLTLGRNIIGGLPEEDHFALRLGAVGTIVETLQATARLQYTSVDSGSTSTGRAYTEVLATLGLRWSF